ncbi:hypothetical protein INR77_13490 [Erythrobacter sp. SCSIO 43205]|uniref:COG3650 family protein n=1 Tax=Erythrobacter sp. SCSIO 43205 TaxID=2779361 RepID=UPI001CA96922|nr:hypothetical protein [Erythrobacter sp. SCSIO 43205]UAB77777.1 hypothetical protein INR77_13490 [Erythrobacter sp. SCSIO 43205]
MVSAFRFISLGAASFALIACTETPGDISRDAQPFDAIAADEAISVLGTEPFWNIGVTASGNGHSARYSTPERPDGTSFPVSRFAGNNGLGFSGELEGRAVVLTITPGTCSDQMSDRDYPYTATLLLGDSALQGCAFTSREPYSEATPS